MASTPQLNIRVPLELKEAFIQKAKEDGTTATDLIIGFMQQYLGIEPSKPVQVAIPIDIDSRLSELEQRLAARIEALEEQQRGKSPKKAA
jgi:antitoxin component of RelBE/YafQ-DinJ toxin-antitoxin module